MNSNYLRVIPRDLFNEGKLLTELGFLSLAILDNKDGIANLLTMELVNEEEGFVVAQSDDGSLFVANLLCRTVGDEIECVLHTTVNCRCKNALRFSCEALNFEGVVFEGKDYSEEFKLFLARLASDCS